MSMVNAISMEKAVNTQLYIKPPVLRPMVQICMALLCSLFSLALQAQTTEVTATIDKNPVMLDESFTLTITANSDVDRNAFDSSILLKDFVVGQTSVSSQTRMVNFQSSQTTTWTVVLFPRAVGRFTIPAISIDGQSSQPFMLEVIPVATTNGQETRDIFVSTELASDEVYVHQQVKYTVKLYLARDLERGSLQAPTMDNADIQQIGNDAEYSEIINGKRYRIIERSFVITPQKSGDIEVNSPIFQGEVATNTRQSFGFFNRTQTVNRLGPTRTLRVLPIPSEVIGQFLPSEFVELTEEWSDALTEWRVGEPVTRTITLTAVGVAESLLPDIEERYPPAIKTYPDQANTASADNGEHMVSQRVESTALIPSQAGDYVLLPVEVEWFNVATQKTEVAVLPARTISVLPSPNAQNTTVAPTDTTAMNDLTGPIVDARNPSTQVTDEPLSQTASTPSTMWAINVRNGWMWSTLGLLLIIAYLLVRTNYHSVPVERISASSSSQVEPTLWRQLESALKNNDTHRIAQTLREWLNEVTDGNSSDLARAVSSLNDGALQALVDDMMGSHYGSQQQQWQSKALHAHLKALRKSLNNAHHSASVLEPLYPKA